MFVEYFSICKNRGQKKNNEIKFIKYYLNLNILFSPQYAPFAGTWGRHHQGKDGVLTRFIWQYDLMKQEIKYHIS